MYQKRFTFCKKQEDSFGTVLLLWSHLGLNQGPPDYESGATNQLSYRTPRPKIQNGFGSHPLKGDIIDFCFLATYGVP